jgi:peptidoglycan hydrolase-like protein with peptidoglycan-binding domain
VTSLANLIQGIDYNKVQTEYQFFPEEYFTGSDLTIYFDDIWLDELTHLQFTLKEQVMPVFGYNSYVWDSVARGNRIIQGSFAIGFKEAGYLYRVFDHIGQLQDAAKPKIAYLAGDQEIPAWLAGVKTNLEGLLDMYDKDLVAAKEVVAATKAKGVEAASWRDMKLGDNNKDFPELDLLQQMIVDNTDSFYNQSGTERYPGLVGPIIWDLTATMSIAGEHAGAISTGPQVVSLQTRLNGYFEWNQPTFTPIKVDGIFGPETKAALLHYQNGFSKTLITPTYSEAGFTGERTRMYLNQKIVVSGWFDGPTKLALLRFQAKNDLPLNGTLDAATRKKLGVDIVLSDRPSQAEKDYADVEGKIWGSDFVDENPKDNNTYFYSGDKQNWLLTEGFDIYVNYGPLPEAILANGGTLPDTVNFNTTVKAIRNIQITGVTQVLGPDGTPIEEIYEFTARDLD